MPQIKAAAPADLRINLLFDQSMFVTAAIEGVVTESIISGLLTAAMILIFLGSWRSTLIVAVSIPLAILSSIIMLYLLGHSLCRLVAVESEPPSDGFWPVWYRGCSYRLFTACCEPARPLARTNAGNEFGSRKHGDE